MSFNEIRLLTLPRIHPTLKTGHEPLHLDGQNLDCCVLDFWRWSASDLLSNATRGRLAEFIVATALDVAVDQARDEWSPYDLQTPQGITVEVKSAAYVQSWYQRQLSPITFLVPKTCAWDATTNTQQLEKRRQAQVYVFALLAHNDQATIDPLNVSQWQFFVLPTATLDARTRSQHSITLPTLKKLAGDYVTYYQLKAKVVHATSNTLSTSSP